MEISIIAIGDELLYGQVTNTNSGDIARAIQPYGWKVREVMTVGDCEHDILEAVKQGFAKSDVVLTTGGLGPTKDDITKGALMKFFGGELQFNSDVKENVVKIFERRGLTINRLTETQAYVPSSCKVIQNPVGTAPVMWFEKGNKILISLPGVPFELRECFCNSVFPLLRGRFQTKKKVSHKYVMACDITESALAEKLETYELALPENIHLAYLPNPGYIRLRLDLITEDIQADNGILSRYHTLLIAALGENFLCDEDMSPAEIVIKRLRDKNLTLAIAESFTGGAIAAALTKVPGCSQVFRGSVTAYCNDVKTSLLNVNCDNISRFGVVSEAVVTEMAKGVATLLKADCGVATSGVAGPGDASDGTKEGVACFGWMVGNETIKTAKLQFAPPRNQIIERGVNVALVTLAKMLSSLPSQHGKDD